MAALPPDDTVPLPPPDAPQRPRYRPPIGIPVAKQKRTASLMLAIFLHVAIIALLIVPFTSPELMREVLGAGGLGPAGGGGGGNQGTGGQMKQERLQYVRVAPAPTPVTTPQINPPVIKPPVVPPPPVPPPPTPQPTPQPTPTTATQSADVKSATSGSGGGAGSDGSGGSGPGSGGGVGSGVGTGKGTSVGAGTGGGPGTVYPPAPTELFLPPLPVPNKAKGTIVVVFDVDSTGKVLDLQFNPTKDGSYNRKLRDALIAIRFRPAVNAQGVPVRARTEITYSL
ncbi:hypothetical protein [Gemmatimonas phototrophica]|nr:hypothetical protein [Gemmatimonas phototrophica]